MLVLLFLYFIAMKQHHSSVSLLSSVNQKHWMVGEWSYSEARFKKTFRISRSTFRCILNRIGPFLARETVTEDPVASALFVSIRPWRLFIKVENDAISAKIVTKVQTFRDCALHQWNVR